MRRQLAGLRPYQLYSADTAAAVFRETGRIQATACAGIAVLAGGMLFGAHTEMPFLADLAGACDGARYLSAWEYPPLFDWLAGFVGLFLTGLYCLLLFHVRSIPPPAVYCEGCDGAGWVRDLEPTRGGCPRCRGDRFTYFGRSVPSGGALPFSTLVEPQVAGRALVERYRSHRWHERLWHEWR